MIIIDLLSAIKQPESCDAGSGSGKRMKSDPENFLLQTKNQPNYSDADESRCKSIWYCFVHAREIRKYKYITMNKFISQVKETKDFEGTVNPSDIYPTSSTHNAGYNHGMNGYITVISRIGLHPVESEMSPSEALDADSMPALRDILRLWCRRWD
ncbi:hypothetical protein BJ165DRAFT_174730 [Panaeolus papilionaceus]|nr:hypothetical protein BJ165DRAFT_174730 [Panaeolus papilionaceus]